MNWKALAIVSSSALLLAAIGVVGYFVWQKPDISLLLRPTAPAVIREVEKLNQVVTVKETVQRVVGLTEPKEPFGEESILIMVQGRATAGVDLSCVTESDVLFTRSRTVTLKLPRAKLLDVFLDEKQTKVWDRHVTWWTPWVPPDPDLEHKARLIALEDVRSAALQAGILGQAQRNAELAISAFLGALGLEVHYKSGD